MCTLDFPKMKSLLPILVFNSFFIGCLWLFPIVCNGQTATKAYFQWDEESTIPAFGNQKSALGVAGPIAGKNGDYLIIAGGANFDSPFWENEKVWHQDIWILPQEDIRQQGWINAGKLDHALAYSAVVSSSKGIVAMGGCNQDQTFDEVLLIKWDHEKQNVVIEYLPSLPFPCAYGSAALIDEKIYLAGGTKGPGLETAMNNFWRLDLEKYGSDNFSWDILPPWPGPERAYNLCVAQHNGYSNCIYVLSGRRQAKETATWEVLSDVYAFDPLLYTNKTKDPWTRKGDMPAPRMAGTAIPVGQSHLFVISGADGSLFQKADSLREEHPGFPKQLLGYHTISDTWFEGGEIPANQVTTHAINYEDHFVLISGEVKPRIRTPQIWKITPVRTASSFGWINGTAVLIYLLLLIGMGIFFSFRAKSTEDFFRGGQRIPWWAAGCSIFATMLSSLTFMSIPAKTYATDWLYFFINMSIIALAPFIIYYVLPFFRRIDATSAYQYLELRFNLAVRLFGSAAYILFQVGRMAIVMYLPALALATVTPISIEMCILLMGLLSVLYSTLGGVEAVIWTDTLQTVVLLGGALLSFLLVMLNKDIGMNEFFSIAIEDGKFKLADWSWDYTGSALWVVVLGGLGQTLIPYSSDQGVVQRYMSVSSQKKAAQSIWTNAGLSFFASLLFFGVGTALYVFYKKNPTALDPTFQTDAVFPLFIARQLPVGIAGMVIAGIFAAAQSTISTSMNSIATAFTTDFIRRFDFLKTEKQYLLSARLLTIVFGILGTGFALLIAYADIKSIWDSFISILGLFGGAMCGLFMLGIFTTKANGIGALIGGFGGALFLWMVQRFTDVSFLLYASIGIFATFLIGFLASLAFSGKTKPLEGLTIFT